MRRSVPSTWDEQQHNRAVRSIVIDLVYVYSWISMLLLRLSVWTNKRRTQEIMQRWLALPHDERCPGHGPAFMWDEISLRPYSALSMSCALKWNALLIPVGWLHMESCAVGISCRALPQPHLLLLVPVPVTCRVELCPFHGIIIIFTAALLSLPAWLCLLLCGTINGLKNSDLSSSCAACCPPPAVIYLSSTSSTLDIIL